MHNILLYYDIIFYGAITQIHQTTSKLVNVYSCYSCTDVMPLTIVAFHQPTMMPRVEYKTKADSKVVHTGYIFRVHYGLLLCNCTWVTEPWGRGMHPYSITS